jgi:uracil-DNA glycosylase
MVHPSKSEEVIQQLLDAMRATLRNYHPTVKSTGSRLVDLIAGTAFFPGGSGIWRGRENRGPLPTLFPDAPVMFVGHNFDSMRAFDKAFENGGEGGGEFWKRLLSILAGASLWPERCFFTNVLMGLKPGSATGSMPSIREYREQCALFLQKQVEIVRPMAVVALGVNAELYVPYLNKPWMKSLHPTDWHFREKVTREQRLKAQGELIAAFLKLQSAE